MSDPEISTFEAQSDTTSPAIFVFSDSQEALSEFTSQNNSFDTQSDAGIIAATVELNHSFDTISESTIEAQTVIDQVHSFDVLEIGPQGPPGVSIVSSSDIFQIISSIPIGGHRVISSMGDGTALYADNITRYKTVIGISVGASGQGVVVDVQTFGKMIEPSWNWDVSKGLFLGSNGLLVQDVPDFGAIVSMGFVVDHETIFISIEAFIERG